MDTMATHTSPSPQADANALFGAPSAVAPPIETPALIAAMLESGKGISDLIFSPGRPPQVEKHGELIAVAMPDGADAASRKTPRGSRAISSAATSRRCAR